MGSSIVTQERLFTDSKLILDLCGGRQGSWSKPYALAGDPANPPYTRIVVDPLAFLGSDARLFPSLTSATPRKPSEFQDVRDLPQIHGILAAPVCTVFSGSGARWPRSDDEIREALALVDACVRLAYVLKPVWWAMENPVGKLNKWLGDPVMSFQPNDYGDPLVTIYAHQWFQHVGAVTLPDETHFTAVLYLGDELDPREG
jgi:hypothetical protein|tara:strand:- start:3163 stop:3765 length:603 start_codon:yes stop_codon:yes gene_type:complete